MKIFKFGVFNNFLVFNFIFLSFWKIIHRLNLFFNFRIIFLNLDLILWLIINFIFTKIHVLLFLFVKKWYWFLTFRFYSALNFFILFCYINNLYRSSLKRILSNLYILILKWILILFFILILHKLVFKIAIYLNGKSLAHHFWLFTLLRRIIIIFLFAFLTPL